MSETSSYVKGLAIGTLLGAAIGGGLAFFLSPHTGAQNRKIVVKKFNVIKNKIQNVSEETIETVQDIFGEVSDATISLYEDGRRLLAKQIKTFQDSLDDIDKDKYADMIDNIGDILEENQRNRAEDVAELKRYWKRNWRKFEASLGKNPTIKKAAKAIASAK